MSMNFDLEAAKRGTPIEYQEAYGWVEIKFIGDWNDEHIVCSVPWSYKPEMISKSLVRMGKRKEVVRYRRYILDYYDKRSVGTMNEGLSTPSVTEGCSGFIGWIDHDWQEYEIGANDE
jgi:hypothetical protein